MLIEEIKGRLATAYRILLALKLFDYAGDVSARIPKTDMFLIRGARVDIKPSTQSSMVDTNPEDMVKLDLDENQLDGELTPPLETAIHVAIYQSRPEVGAIVHAHPKMVTAFSMVGLPIEPVYVRGIESTGDELPLFENSDPISSLGQAKRLVEVLGQKRACLMRSHGLVTVGRTIESACLAAINLEEAAYMQWIASMLGKPRNLPAASIVRRKEVWDNQNFLSSVWQYYEEATSRTASIASQETSHN